MICGAEHSAPLVLEDDVLTISDKAIEELVELAQGEIEFSEYEARSCEDPEWGSPIYCEEDIRGVVIDWLRGQKQNRDAFRTDLTPSPVEAQRAVEAQKKLGY